MSFSKKWIVTASLITLGLSGCGMFGSNPVEGKWKVTSATSNEHIGMGYSSIMSKTLSTNLDGQVFKFTGSKMTGPSGSVPVAKYVIKKNTVEIHLKGPNGAEDIVDGTLSNHDKDLSLNMHVYTLQMKKIS